MERISGRLLEALPGTPYTFRFHIVENEQVNAVPFPGGEVVIFTGLLAAAEAPEEVAGVLAHEIQHVLHRHGLENLLTTIKWQIALGFLLGDMPACSSVYTTI